MDNYHLTHNIFLLSKMAMTGFTDLTDYLFTFNNKISSFNSTIQNKS